jgi:NagD protein
MEYKNYLIDMDGVLVRGANIVPGATQFLERLRQANCNYLILTNNPIYTPADLSHRLRAIGMEVPESKIFTSAMATAQFLHRQQPHGKAFVIGESGLTSPIHYVGYIITDLEPDYVVLGETYAYNLDLITKAIRFIADGARFIATNPDVSGPSETGIVPACGAMAALIEKTTGVSPFFCGQAQLPDDAQCAQLYQRSLGGDRDDWGPHGYGYRRRCHERYGYDPRADRRHATQRYRSLPLPANACV